MDRMLQMPFFWTIEVDAIRLLGRGPNGDGLYLIPTTHRAPEMTPAPDCLRTLGPRQRERETRLQRRMDRNARRLSLQLFAIRGAYGGTATGFDLDAYRHGRAGYGSIGRRMMGMAPDGVARVELRLRDGTRRVVPVRGNVWLTTTQIPGRWPRAVDWLDGQGNVLRRLR
jgi:hypothetical protein